MRVRAPHGLSAAGLRLNGTHRSPSFPVPARGSDGDGAVAGIAISITRRSRRSGQSVTRCHGLAVVRGSGVCSDSGIRWTAGIHRRAIRGGRPGERSQAAESHSEPRRYAEVVVLPPALEPSVHRVSEGIPASGIVRVSVGSPVRLEPRAAVYHRDVPLEHVSGGEDAEPVLGIAPSDVRV